MVMKTDAPGYVVDPVSGAILNNDEQAWMRYKAERESAQLLASLQKQVAALTQRVQQLEEKNK